MRARHRQEEVDGVPRRPVKAARRITTTRYPGPILNPGPKLAGPKRRRRAIPAGAPKLAGVGPKLALPARQRCRAIPDATRSGPTGRRPSAPAGCLKFARQVRSGLRSPIGIAEAV